MNNPNPTTEQKGLSLKYFRELVEKTSSAEEIKKELGDWKEEYKISTPETLQKKDKEKLKVYEELEIKDLPKDWRAELARIKELEKNQVDYLQKKEELRFWTETFGVRKPDEIEEEIKQLEEKQIKTETELNARIQELETDLKTIQQEKETILTDFKQKEGELKEEIRKWQENFNGLDLEAVKSEWEEMKKRPDIPISEKDFYDNFARRETLQQTNLEREKLNQIKVELEEHKIENQQLYQAISRILNGLIIQRYALAEPVLNVEQARQAIARLLEETQEKWEDYSAGNKENGSLRNLALDLSLGFQPGKKKKVPQILEWIKEARESGDYEGLFEKWNGGKEYSREYDFDGSLFLLGKRLEVRDEEEVGEQI